MQKLSGSISAVMAVASALLLAAFVSQIARARALPELTTPYHAVALTNGLVYFGKVEGLGDSFLMLRDVYYVQNRPNPDTKQTATVLVKRGGEWHGPDRMMINREHVLLIEPVKDDSQVGKLIAEQSKPR